MAAAWATIFEALAADFSDLPDAASLARLLVRLTIAALLGGALGWQRERQGKAAGVRTHMLVALGTAVFVIIPTQLNWPSADLSRVIQGIITGIGFLGTGTILKRNSERFIQGLTTAADIWLTAAVGIAAGLGQLISAILISVLAFAILATAVHFQPIAEADALEPPSTK